MAQSTENASKLSDKELWVLIYQAQQLALKSGSHTSESAENRKKLEKHLYIQDGLLILYEWLHSESATWGESITVTKTKDGQECFVAARDELREQPANQNNRRVYAGIDRVVFDSTNQGGGGGVISSSNPRHFFIELCKDGDWKPRVESSYESLRQSKPNLLVRL